MNNLLNDIYNEILGKSWNIESIKNRLNAMTTTLKQRDSDPAKVDVIMKNKTHIEELMERISTRLDELGITLKAFTDLNRHVSNYYENE
jgi:hypothetical protein